LSAARAAIEGLPVLMATCSQKRRPTDLQENGEGKERESDRVRVYQAPVAQPLHGLVSNDQSRDDEQDPFGIGVQVLGLAVPGRVLAVGRLGRCPDGDEGKDGGRGIEAGMNCIRDQRETAGQEAERQFATDEGQSISVEPSVSPKRRLEKKLPIRDQR
jgi:hypothetical protein